MDERLKDKKALKLFLAIALGVSVIWEALYIATDAQYSVITMALMWTPGIAGIITSLIYYRKKNALGIRPCRIRYILLGILIPLAYLAVSYGIAWLALGDATTGVDALAQMLGYQSAYGIPSVAFVAIYLIAGMLGSCISATGEELGWRGFMYPVMERVSGRKKALLFSGLIWACWHMPLIIAGSYQSETMLWYGLIMFTVELIIISVIMAWLRTVSESVIPAILVHASHNLFDQTVFQQMSTNENVPYFAGEQGFVTILFAAVIALAAGYFWKHSENKKLTKDF